MLWVFWGSGVSGLGFQDFKGLGLAGTRAERIPIVQPIPPLPPKLE